MEDTFTNLGGCGNQSISDVDFAVFVYLFGGDGWAADYIDIFTSGNNYRYTNSSNVLFAYVQEAILIKVDFQFLGV